MSSGETSVVRQVRRTVTSSGIPEDNVEIIRNYQVFRGLSPNTATRLEARLRELEDALEQERQARLRAEQSNNELAIEIAVLNERLEEAEGQTGAQSEFNRRRDAELAKLRKDFELLSVQHESAEASLRKRHQDAMNEVAEQIDQLNKHKARFEKEKQTLIFEIESSNSALDASNKARAHAESKLESLEDQLRRMRPQLEELQRQNADLSAWKIKLSQENSDLHRQLQDVEGSTGGLAKMRVTLQTQVDEMKSQLDDLNSERNNLSINLNNCQVDLENMTARCEEEAEAAANLRAQLQKALADLAHFKAKYDQDVSIRITEFDDTRRKLNARILELEDIAEQARNRANRLEKEKSKLTIEIRDLASELDASNANGGELARRLKASETSIFELTKRTDDLSGQLQGGGSENQRLQMEVARLKQALADAQEKADSANREAKKLADAFREAQGQLKDLNRQVTELLNIRGQLEAERDRLAIELADAQEALREAQARFDSNNASLNQLRIDFEHRLREKDDELEGSRKSGQRGIDELQKSVLEIETKYKGELGRHKKKYETDIREYEINIDNMSRSNAELVKANKSLAQRVKDLEMGFETERSTCEDAKNSFTISERKRIALQTELEDVRALLEAADRARKAAENAAAEAATRVNELTIQVNSVGGDRRRLESDLTTALAGLEEATQARRSVEERADRLQLEVNRLLGELARAQENYANAENLRKQLETEIREISVRLEEAESYAQREGKRLVAKLQTRVRELESELELEQRRSRDLMAENKKLQRIVVELRTQSEEDHRIIVELTDQVNSLQAKIALLKRQLSEADEVVNITMAKYRHAQQLLEDCERRADTAEKNVTVQITRGVSHHHLPPAVAGNFSNRARSMSVSRETRVIRN